MVPDWAAGTLFIAGAVRSRRDGGAGLSYQVAAWAFMLSLLFASSVGSLEEWLAPEPSEATNGLVNLSLGVYLFFKAVLFLIAFGGLVSSVHATEA